VNGVSEFSFSVVGADGAVGELWARAPGTIRQSANAASGSVARVLRAVDMGSSEGIG